MSEVQRDYLAEELERVVAERDKYRAALREIRGKHCVNAPVLDIVERALQEAGNERT